MQVYNASQVANGGATASLVPVRDGERLVVSWDTSQFTYRTCVINNNHRARFTVGRSYRLQQRAAKPGLCYATLSRVLKIQPQYLI